MYIYSRLPLLSTHHRRCCPLLLKQQKRTPGRPDLNDPPKHHRHLHRFQLPLLTHLGKLSSVQWREHIRRAVYTQRHERIADVHRDRHDNGVHAEHDGAAEVLGQRPGRPAGHPGQGGRAGRAGRQQACLLGQRMA